MNQKKTKKCLDIMSVSVDKKTLPEDANALPPLCVWGGKHGPQS